MEGLGIDFDACIDEIDARVRALEPALSPQIERDRLSADSVEWVREPFRATLILHRAEAIPHFSLTLLAGEEQHPDAMGIGVDDADLVEMLAQPIAALLAGRGE